MSLPSNTGNAVPLSQRTWFVILMLLLVFPIGLYLVWTHPRWSQNAKIGVTAAWAFLAIGGLRSRHKESSAPVPPSVSYTAPSPAQDTDITPASSTYLKEIGDGLHKGTGVHLASTGYQIRAKNFSNVYFVAGKLVGPGADTWAIWAVGGGLGQQQTSAIMSADSIAASFSDWPRGDRTKAQIWFTDPDGTRLKNYVEEK